MPLEVKLWKIEADQLQPIDQARLDLEERLEELLRGDIGLLSDDLLVIGSQIARYGVPLDLLAVDRDCNLVVVELKRDRTPRDVVAQALDYASWVQGLGGLRRRSLPLKGVRKTARVPTRERSPWND